MADLKVVNETELNNIFDVIKQTVSLYNSNLHNNLFIKEENETYQNAYKRGETCYEQNEANMNHLNLVLQMEAPIIEFFQLCKENKQILIDHNNQLINQLLLYNKQYASSEQHFHCRNEWNKKRIETPEQRSRRESQELLEEITFQKTSMIEIQNQIVKEKQQLQQEKEVFEKQRNECIQQYNQCLQVISQNSGNFVGRNEFSSLVENYNFLLNQHNEMYTDYQNKQHQPTPIKPIDNQQPIGNSNLFHTVYNPIPTPFNVHSPKSIPAPVDPKFNVTTIQKNQLEEWTSLKCGDVLFDSEQHNWRCTTSQFNRSIVGKKQLVFLIEDTEGEKFGYYSNTIIGNTTDRWIVTDNSSFEFNLQSKNGRLQQPVKYEVKHLIYGGHFLCRELDEKLIWLGDIRLFKENRKNDCNCQQNNNNFNYHGIQDALDGKVYPVTFVPKRIIVIQMN